MSTSSISQFCQQIPLCEGAQTLLTENSKVALAHGGVTARPAPTPPSPSEDDRARVNEYGIPSPFQGELRLQFNMLSCLKADQVEALTDEERRGLFRTADANPKRNRYSDVKPYDSNRVVFGKGAYFNASWVLNRSAIACQGPLPGEIDQFWEMISCTGVKAIVSLVSPTELSRSGTPKCSDFFSRHIVREDELFDDKKTQIIFRELKRTRELEKSVEVEQYHLLGWPDQGVVPASTLAQLVLEVRKKVGDGKILVHCSAGIGRTGTFLAAYEALRTNSKEIYRIGSELRSLKHGRDRMIQSEEQYRLAHDTVQILLA